MHGKTASPKATVMMADEGSSRTSTNSLKRERGDDLARTPQIPSDYAYSSGVKIKCEPAHSPARSSTSSNGLSDAPSTIPPVSPAPDAFSSLNSNGAVPPPAKKPKLTFQEKELQKQQKAIEKFEKEQARARREAEKEELKRKADAEKEAKRLKVGIEREERRIAQEAEKVARTEKKRQLETEKAAKEEDKKKALRNQKTLNSFFKAPPKQDAQESLLMGTRNLGDNLVVPVVTSRQKRSELSEYEKLFPSFFVHENVTVAPYTRWERDAAGLEYVQAAIDRALKLGDAAPPSKDSDDSDGPTPFNAQELFGLPGNDFRQRGKTPRPIQDIMDEMHKPSLSTDSQNTQFKRARSMLSTIPYKYLKFFEDVRPPYQGTFTRPLKPGTGTRLARTPWKRKLPDVDYDYDSEAEWLDEPGDDLGGEDLDSDGEDEDADGNEDLDDFLDNDGQDEFQRQQAMANEPVSSGLCWEDELTRNLKGGAINKQVYHYQMEVILSLGDLSQVLPIDPFSTKYWPEEIERSAPAPGLMRPPRVPLGTSKSTNVTIARSASKSGPLITAKADDEEKKLIAPGEMDRFRALLQSEEYKQFSKGTLVEAIWIKFDRKETKKAIGNTLDSIAKRVKGRWELTDGA